MQRLLLFVLAVFAFPVLSTAQGARSQLNGTVTDSTGAVVVGAPVVATALETQVKSKTATTDAGVYVIPYLPPGRYTIEVTAPGFRTATSEPVTLRVGQTVTLDFKLDVDTIAELVYITATAPAIETSTSEIGRYVSNKEFETWPVPVGDGQRQIQAFIFSSLPGAVGGEFQGSINGGRNYSHEILIEGMPLGRNLQGGSSNEMSPPTEMVQEFKLQTGTISAEYGGGETAVASFAVKSGTNNLRGSGAYYFQDASIDANSYTNKALKLPKPNRKLKNGALAVGGPIIVPGLYDGHDRSFFFLSVEGTDEQNFTSSNFRSVPTSEYLNGDFSRLFDPAYTGDPRSGSVIGTDALGRPVRYGQIYDPRTTRMVGGQAVRDPFPNNVVPRALWDRVARNTIEQGLWDAPDLDKLLNNMRTLDACCPFFNQKTLAFKVDDVLSTRHKLSFYLGREWRRRNNSVGGRWGTPPGQPTNHFQLQRTPSWMVRASEQWVVGNNLLHRAAYGYNEFGNLNFAVHANAGWPSKIGMSNVPDSLFPPMFFMGPPVFGGVGQIGTTARSGSYEGSHVFQDDLTFAHGRHNVKTGFEARVYFTRSNTLDDTGRYNFHQQQTNLPGFDLQTGNAYASFLLGAMQSWSREVVRINPDYKSRDFSLFVQDDLKLTPRLTLNLGLRWEFIQPQYEVNGFMTTMDPTKPNPGAGGRPGALVFADEQGRKTFFDPYYKQVQPRLGVAYAPSEKIALSAGYSIGNTPPVMIFGGGVSTLGYNGSLAVNQSTRPTQFPQDPVMYLSDRFPDFQGTVPNRDPAQANRQGTSVITGDMSRRELYQNYHASIQYALPASFTATASYIGNYGTRLPFDRQINRAPFGEVMRLGDLLFERVDLRPDVGVPLPYPGFTGQVLDALRPFPQYSGVTLHTNQIGKARYDSLQTTLERRFSRGLAVLGAYTWSKARDAANRETGTTDDGLAQDGSGLDWAPAEYDIPHVVKLTWIYELPIGPDKALHLGGVPGKILGGWTVSAIQNYRSGDVLRISDSRINGAGYPIRPDAVPGVDQVSYAGGSVDIQNGTVYLNRDAFATQPLSARGVPTRIGTTPRYLTDARGPGRAREDLGIMKRVFFGSRSVEARVDILNLFNRSGLGGPRTDLADPNFGRIFGVAYGPRRFQFSARVTF
jgi:hypothetical protein